MGAYFDQFEQIITAVAKTSTQISSEIRRPAGATGIVFAVDVTAGSTLLLDLWVRYINENTATVKYLIQNLPSADFFTGVSTAHILLGPYGATGDIGLASGMNYRNIPLFERMKAFVIHGNANAATYNVYAQWI